MGIKMTRAEWFEKRMIELHRELDRNKVITARKRKEHRLAWRRARYRKQQGQTVAAEAERMEVSTSDVE